MNPVCESAPDCDYRAIEADSGLASLAGMEAAVEGTLDSEQKDDMAQELADVTHELGMYSDPELDRVSRCVECIFRNLCTDYKPQLALGPHRPATIVEKNT